MKIWLLWCVLAGLLLVSGPTASGDSSRDVAETMQSLPLVFIPNQGQWDDRVLFQADAGPVTVWVSSTGIIFQMTRLLSEAGPEVSTRGNTEQLLLTVSLPGGRKELSACGEEMVGYRTNYLFGNDQGRWYRDLPGFRAVRFSEVYPGIDLRLYGRGDGLLEYDFIVQPGADPSIIRVEYDGAESMSINANGELVIGTAWNKVVEKRPWLYQRSPLGPVSISGGYTLTDRFCFGFDVGNYDRSRTLVIDPVLAYSTYLGGGGSEMVEDMAVDASGAVYVVGHTNSRNFPLQSPLQTTFSSTDAFVAKLSFSGDALLFSTYLGGTWDDYGRGIAVGANGRVYVTGETESTNFPVVNAADPSLAGDKFDAFVSVINGFGNGLVFSTYLGGALDDYGRDIAVTPSGTVLVTGETKSADFPTLNPYQASLASAGHPDAFLTMYSGAGVLTGSTYLGGTGDDYGQAIAWSGIGGIGLAGKTNSGDFPVFNGLQTGLLGATDVFVTRLNESGNGLLYSSYLGGSANELPGGLVFGSDGAAVVTGSTESSDFPTANELQGDQVGWDAFLARLSLDGSTFEFSTYLGGSGSDYGEAVTIDATTGNIYVAGETFSADFPTVDPLQADLSGACDAFVAGVSPDGSAIFLSSYLGGSTGLDYGTSVGFSGNLFVSGYTYSTDFPTQVPLQSNHRGGNTDGYISRLILAPLCADVNGNGYGPDIADLIYMVMYMFQDGSPPPVPEACDINGDSSIADIADLVDLVTYMFGSGAAPNCW